MDEKLKTTFEELENLFWRTNNELGKVTYNLVKNIVQDEGGRISFDVLDECDEEDPLLDIYNDCFTSVPYADENEITIWFGDGCLNTLFINQDGELCYELQGGRICGFEWLPPYFSSPICTGLLKWHNTNKKNI